ncbi:hypothetical protein PSY31_24035, partial [Shigella flexneri]|nr:hypothetical protein [Shigella flexneri]
ILEAEILLAIKDFSRLNHVNRQWCFHKILDSDDLMKVLSPMTIKLYGFFFLPPLDFMIYNQVIP